jgi:acetylglutamate kinase
MGDPSITTSVYKVGGPALEDATLLGPLAAELARERGRVLLVHGGGPVINRLLSALAIESRFVGGRRVTTPEAMDVVEMALSGLVNKALAAGLTRAGVRTLGLSGRDGGMIRARLEPDLGQVGLPDLIDIAAVEAAWAAGFVPVVSPVSLGPSGEAVNVNADEAALGLARAVGASRLVYLSDVDGVRVGEAAVATLRAAEMERLIADGTISGGMALKVRVALAAVRAGIPEVIIAGKSRLLGGFAGTRIIVNEVA